MATMAALFTNLGKFSSNENGVDLTGWLRQFDRCCVVANKTDDLVKGQLLMLFVEGQAEAILEELEENNDGAPQNYTNCVDTLKSRFYTPATRESKMVEFETRTQQFHETEDEFMLSLLKLYRTANPEHDDNIRDAAIKRKLYFPNIAVVFLFFAMTRMQLLLVEINLLKIVEMREFILHPLLHHLGQNVPPTKQKYYVQQMEN